MNHAISSSSPSCVGAVLIGGRSTRMEGDAKHELVLPDGRTMMERAVDTLETLCDEVVILGRADQSGAIKTSQRTRQFLSDRRRDVGPLGGIEAMLESGVGSRYLLLPCDMPFVTRELLSSVISHDPCRPLVFVQREDEVRWAIFPLRIDTHLLPVVRDLLDRGEHALHRLLTSPGIDAARFVVPREDGRLLENINTPGAFQAMRRGCAE